mmetsp:Transcript_75697/g.133659  ORF Transcript_75697/g.133659 Transcript_75697/m.133659 type:complete len:503 (+) Transcript_75697:140-1648(+)|eukprot:CAMPEP_0197663802 /NCGR_PEP_ID=MMETSP1338-20131121/58246_1 /TAXON_ID=43686 ORGANISM="Pelagodinium beii, Strain RCC1491" /NCGR_SAMPLE_ID=MMETSP1338 /ASSEMBLY_ACC=CAM_ASM_000754 /LENGTH=502 /DNA_ID=CAMNT_0043242303 /DNA_START=120 /DNA_END=1628 /DNA_ORIENTATION=+
MVRASQKDAYEAYYLCRLKEVTERAPDQLPRLTTAQATLGSRRALLAGEATEPSKGGSQMGRRSLRMSTRMSNLSSSASSMASIKTAYKDALAHWTDSEIDEAAEAVAASKTDATGDALRKSESAPQLPTLTPKLQRPAAPILSLKEDEMSSHEKRAFEVMSKARFFKDLDQAALKPVLKHMSFLKRPSGVVLFRQGDPPTNCYVVMEGNVNFYTGANSKSPRKPCTEGLENESVPPDKNSRVNTFERWSTFAVDSKMGRLVHRGEAGAVFGELALMDETEVRKATAQCSSDCELLAVPTSAFEPVRQHIREVELRKRYFLGISVPGMKDVPEPVHNGTAHPAILFEQMLVNEGHVFIRAGVVGEPVFYVVNNGSVKFCLRQETGSGESSQVAHDILHRGGIFGCLPHPAKEPFSIIADSTPCEVYRVSGQHFRSLPEGVLEGVHEKLSTETAKRLRRICVSKRMGWEYQQQYQKRHRPKDEIAAELLSLSSRELRTRMMQG